MRRPEVALSAIADVRRSAAVRQQHAELLSFMTQRSQLSGF